ncbi:MAG: anti-sigma factor [Solirubrobacterales bacterium]|nr:anti-sigma factor [Solirubrobacterales bacterium]
MAQLIPRPVDVAGYALGTLDQAEQTAFERHFADCESCPSELAELAPAIRLLHQAVRAETPPTDLREGTLAAIERDAAKPAERATSPAIRPPRRRRAWFPRLAVTGFAVLAVAAAGLVGLRVGEQRQPGTVEVDTRLASPRDGATAATVRVTETQIGRIVAMKSDSLPGLDNEREFYELWFVGPGDSARDPNRVSAGTFHPDPQGRTAVRLAAAAVPRNYPVLSATREPRNGDPRATGPEVLRSRPRRLGATPAQAV